MDILIAEDDRTSATVLSETLRRMGHRVTATPDGLDAWSRFQDIPPDVVITDWMMPGMDGLELCQRIRSHHTQRYPYILILTALTGKERFLEGMDAGADDYLTKPFDPDELAARLRVAERILGLTEEVRRLEGLLPICSYCKRIRDQADRWTTIESYITERCDASFTHSICPSCYQTEVEMKLGEMTSG